MRDVFSVSRMLQLKTAFISYNISRLRELIRYLPRKKYELFQNIPLWLHVNLPQVPGYVDAPKTPCGIYRFHDSGFWRSASQRYKIDKRDYRRRHVEKSHILGLYLMGSSGTLAQTDRSDFDYWVVVDGKGKTPEALTAFEKKLKRITLWSKERYDQEVGLFVLNLPDVRNNIFSAVDKESSGSAQRTFLKEEFYRTLIMIAGKIPYWAVTPPRLKEADYRQWVRQSRQVKSVSFIPEEYVDLGNMETIGRGECFGALLWQIYKARKYPFKSLIKAGLIAYYYFFVNQNGLLCDDIKAGFGGARPGEDLTDPYAVVYKTVIGFFESLDNAEGLLLIKECIFLRLSDFSHVGSAGGLSPKRRLLDRYVSEWEWGDEKTIRLAAYPQWTEQERLIFEEKIFQQLAFLYAIILRDQEDSPPEFSINSADLLMLKHRIATAIKNRPGKLPRSSAYLKAHLKDYAFHVCGHSGGDGQPIWTVYNRGSLQTKYQVYQGPELLRTIGWLAINGIVTGEANIRYQLFELSAHRRQIKRFVNEVHRFIGVGSDRPRHFMRSPKWDKIVVLLQPHVQWSGHRLNTVDFLAVNSWGEIFFESIGLAHRQDAASICYNVSEILWKYQNENHGESVAYRVFQLDKPVSPRWLDMIDADLASFMKNDPSREPVSDVIAPYLEEDDLPLLDLL